MAPRGSLKRKKPSGGKKAATLDRLVDIFERKSGDRETHATLAQEQAQWTREYQDTRLELAQRMVALREREARAEEEGKREELKRLHAESMTTQMLRIADSGVSVARLLEMRRAIAVGSMTAAARRSDT